tara:strand:- start:347 stop:847 length:501 start_codon:yes stop_codon:yes gene_type:complete
VELIDIAQLVTGIATLIVATVLIWQMVIQKKTLDIAHRDADSSISLETIGQRTNLNMWFSEKLDDEFEDKLNKGFDSLNNKEKAIVRTWIAPNLTIMNTEYRLGRLDQNHHYYKASVMRLLEYKAFQERIETLPIMRKGSPLHPDLVKLIKETYQELTGKEFQTST